MYNQYFGFKEAPFSIAPDPRYLYMTAQHREALAHLVYGLNSEGGCILLTGEVGTGKTTICRCLLEQVPEQAKVALVLNPKVSEVELLETICDELKISYPDKDNSLKTYTDKIYTFLIESNRNNEKTVLIIDEAQNLSSDVLEQLRLLTNLETNQRKLLQIIILGQPELLDILARKEMRQLAQRITARFHLQPLTRDEVKAYVSHRLAVAGQNIQLFSDSSIKLLYKLSKGVPRLINVLCDRSLLGAYVESQSSVSPVIIKKAAIEVFGELKNVENKNRSRRWFIPLAAVIGIALLAIAIIVFIMPAAQDKKLTESLATIENDITENSTPSASNETATVSEITDSENSGQQQQDNHAALDLNAMPVVKDDDATTATLEPIGREYDDINEILNNNASSNIAAYQSLFKLWQENFNITIADTACKQARSFSLSCLYKQGNLNNLKAHNRPAVLKLINNDGDARHVTIASIQDEYAILYANHTEYKIKLSELDRYWYGQFVLLWKKPKNYLSAITPGGKSQIVHWLKLQFDDEKLSINNFYDKALVSKVKNFQSQEGLVADGIVGPVTIIHLNTRSGIDIPRLIQKI
jgi:general secretion pathway protein A